MLSSTDPNLVMMYSRFRFGLMDGGVDYFLSEHFSRSPPPAPPIPTLPYDERVAAIHPFIRHVQKHLDETWFGCQNVGTCEIIDVEPFLQNRGWHVVKSGNSEGEGQGEGLGLTRWRGGRYLAHTPTMITPKSLPKDDGAFTHRPSTRTKWQS